MLVAIRTVGMGNIAMDLMTVNLTSMSLVSKDAMAYTVEAVRCCTVKTMAFAVVGRKTVDGILFALMMMNG